MNRKEISVLIGLLFAFVCSFCCQSITAAEAVRANTLRLHIIANSDTPADQSIKLAVRDEILKMDNLMPQNTADFAAALKNVQQNLTKTENAINNFLQQQKAGYTAQCSIEQFYFDTTSYSGFALPQGEYTALTVRLGQAQGKNWWCVMYPALCSQTCGEIVLENCDDFIKTDKITARFKVVEIYENIKEHFEQRPQKYKNLPQTQPL